MSSNTNIGNTPVNQGYVQLIHTGETGGIDGTLRTLYDGDGTASDLQIASNAVKVSTTLYIGSDTLQTYIQNTVNAMTIASPTFSGTANGVNLVLSGDLTVNGTTTTLDTTNLKVTDNLIELNQGVSSNANDSGIIIERGSTGDNAIIMWDESADKFTLGTTTATSDATGNITITTGTLVANTFEGNLTGTASNNLTIANNLSDLNSASTARTNLGLGTLATLSSIDFDRIDGTAYITSAESYSDSDAQLMTAAAIDDLIVSKGYGTGDGDMTGVSITASNPLDISQSNTTSGNYTATISLDATEFGSYLTDMTDPIVGASDELAVLDSGTLKRKLFNEIGLSSFNNDSNFITSATAPITALNNATANELVTVGSTTTELDAEANLTFNGTTLTCNGSAVFNETSADRDFRIESNSNQFMFFVDGGNDRIGINNSAPDKIVDIGGDPSTIQFTNTRNASWTVGDEIAEINFHSNDASGIGQHSVGFIKMIAGQGGTSLSGEMAFGTAVYNTASTERMRIDDAGNIKIFDNNSNPSASTNNAFIFCDAGEMKVMDDGGAITTISPHNFSLIPNGASEERAWSYYSEKQETDEEGNNNIVHKVNIDMMRLARLVEGLTGEKLVYTEQDE